MSGPFSALQFLRKIPAPLLSAYFKRFNAVEVAVFGQQFPKSSDLMTFWKTLPDEARRTAESDFGQILEMMDELGVQSIRKSSQEAGCGVELSAAWEGRTLEEKVFISFVDFKNLWDTARAIAYADRVSDRYWQRRKNLPPDLMDDSEEACDVFAQNLGEFLHSSEGRGKQCKVERYRADDGRIFFFALFEDFARSSLEWENNDLQAHRRRQALQYIFQYSPQAGELAIYCPNATSHIHDFQKIFSESILNIEELGDDDKDSRIYDMRSLTSPDFQFKWEPEWCFEDVQLIKLRLTKCFSNQRVVFEAGRRNGSEAVYGLLDSWRKAELLDNYFVTQAEIRVRYQTNANRSRSYSFTVTWPNYCSLKPDTLGKHLQEMLALSGIELKEPENNGTLAQEKVTSS